jgi:F-type H+-transporting ATPase subunit a
MAAGTELSPTEYITHHLTFYTRGIAGHDDSSFWAVNIDTLVMTLICGALAFGFLWLFTRKAAAGVPSKTQAFVELALSFVDKQVKGIYHGTSNFVGPLALTTFVLVLMLNAMDFLPVDIMAKFYEHVFGLEHWRTVPTADVNTTFALALSIFVLMIFYSIKAKGLGGWLYELISSPFGLKPLWAAPFLLLFNVLFQIVEYVSKPLSHSLRLYGNIYAGEIIFLLLGLLAASGIGGAVGGGLLHLLWSIFHILIVGLQAYIFMMLTVVYITMAQEHH